jgi:hypothetical protein
MQAEQDISAQADDAYAAVANILLVVLRQRGKPGPVTRAVKGLLERIARSVYSLVLLYRHNPKDPELDASSILRTIYDAHIQLLYILQNPEPRAKLYNDFYWVEWHKGVELFDSQSEPLFKLVSESPRRAELEASNREQFNAVEATYRKQSGGGYRRNWYDANDLSVLSKRVGYEVEYLCISRAMNPAVHSSAWAIRNAGHSNGRIQVWMGWQFLFRCLGRTLEYEQLTGFLPEELMEKRIVPTYKSLYDVSDEILESMRRDMMDEGDED